MDHSSATLLTDIALSIVFAAGASHLARLVRQPLILGYVLGGILLGTHVGFGLIRSEASIELISEIGLILLLFIIGLEINLREFARLGRSIVTLGIVQVLACVGLGLAVLRIAGVGAAAPFDRLYLAIALALSSTLIVVKLLHDKFEVSTPSGRLTIGVLVLQDVWAILFMAVQPNLLNPQLVGLAKSLALGVLVVVSAFAVSRLVLTRLFRAAAKTPELVLLTAIAWCFVMSGVAEQAGLSRAMGALIAGLSIAAFPYGADVIAKLAGIRDFFVTLFFVSLGLKFPVPNPALLGAAGGMAAFVLVSRILTIVPTVRLMRQSVRVGSVAAINLAQISEFSLVILMLGAGYGHISPAVESTMLAAMLTGAILSPYLIHANHRLAAWLVRGAAAVGVKELVEAPAGVRASDGDSGRDIVLLGCYRAGEAFLQGVASRAPDLAPRILVIDYNAALEPRLQAQGFQWAYGDLAHPETLKHLGIEGASIIVCSLSDTFLKGISTTRLLGHLTQLAPEARIIMVADDHHQAASLAAGGAREVVIPDELTGEHLLARLREEP